PGARQLHPDPGLDIEQLEDQLMIFEVRARRISPRITQTTAIPDSQLLLHSAIDPLRCSFGSLHAEAVQEVPLTVITSRIALGDELLGAITTGDHLKRDHVRGPPLVQGTKIV